MSEDRPTYPYPYTARFTAADREKLLGFAQTLGLTPGQVLRFLLRQASKPEALVQFGTREQWDRDDICVD